MSRHVKIEKELTEADQLHILLNLPLDKLTFGDLVSLIGEYNRLVKLAEFRKWIGPTARFN